MFVRDENEEWKRLHNEKLHTLYRSSNLFRVIKCKRLRCTGRVARMKDGRSAFNVLTVKSTRMRPLGRPRCRWEDDIRMYLKEIGINMRNCGNSAKDWDYWRALVNAALSLRVP